MNVSNKSVSVIIPVIDDLQNLMKLFDSLMLQDQLPSEIVVIDSSSNNETEDYLKNFLYPIPIVYRRVGRAFKGDRITNAIQDIFPRFVSNFNLSKGRAYPYEATNRGVEIAQSEWLAFLDSTTIPEKSWIKESLNLIDVKKVDIIFGKTKYYAQSRYQKIFRAATWGDIGHETMPGTVIKKNLYFPIKEGVRAGGDVEWRQKVKNSFDWYIPPEANLRYFNVPKNIITSSKKMFIYQMHSARVNIQHTVKDIYLGIFLLLSAIIVPKWNLIVGVETSPFFIPNITKTYLLSICAVYFGALVINRGLFTQLRDNVFLMNILKFIIFMISLYCVYNWNESIAGWVEESVWFIPHITKIFVSLVILIALIYRGLYFPLTHGISKSYLFPYTFVLVGILGIVNDLLKAPGYLTGAIISIFIKK
jgi:glycosyltransferase involved in cell wall biosynthesis